MIKKEKAFSKSKKFKYHFLEQLILFTQLMRKDTLKTEVFFR